MKNWLKKIFGKKENEPTYKVVKKDGATKVYDQLTLEYLNSKLPNPNQAQLAALFDATETLILSRRVQEKNSNRLIPEEILRITDKKVLQNCKAIFEISDDSKGHLMSIGTYLFDFVLQDGTVHQIEYLGYDALRFRKSWKNDAHLKKPQAFLEWLYTLGITSPLEEWKEQEKRMLLAKERLEAWKSVAPKTLQKQLNRVNLNPDAIEKLFFELHQEIPNGTKLLLSLFHLYGYGFRDWTGGIPTYELLPERILLGIPIENMDLIFALPNLTPEHKEGIARLLSDRNFQKTRKADIPRINQSFKKSLWKHLQEQGDENKIRRFEKEVWKPIKSTKIELPELLNKATLPVLPQPLFMHYLNPNLVENKDDPEWQNQIIYFWKATEKFEKKSLPANFKTFGQHYFVINKMPKELSVSTVTAIPWFGMEGGGKKFFFLKDGQDVSLKYLTEIGVLQYVKLINLTANNSTVLTDRNNYCFVMDENLVTFKNNNFIYKNKAVSIAKAYEVGGLKIIEWKREAQLN